MELEKIEVSAGEKSLRVHSLSQLGAPTLSIWGAMCYEQSNGVINAHDVRRDRALGMPWELPLLHL